MGVMLYELLTGEMPFEGDSYQEVSMVILFSEVNLDGVDKKVIEKALNKNKEEWWQSAGKRLIFPGHIFNIFNI